MRNVNAGNSLGPLGAGGMGEVCRAKDTRLGREVAIKVLPSHLSDNPDLKTRFEREVKAISQLTHPHICTLYDVGSENGTDFLVMELLEGQSLADLLEKGAPRRNRSPGSQTWERHGDQVGRQAARLRACESRGGPGSRLGAYVTSHERRCFSALDREGDGSGDVSVRSSSSRCSSTERLRCRPMAGGWSISRGTPAAPRSTSARLQEKRGSGPYRPRGGGNPPGRPPLRKVKSSSPGIPRSSSRTTKSFSSLPRRTGNDSSPPRTRTPGRSRDSTSS